MSQVSSKLFWAAAVFCIATPLTAAAQNNSIYQDLLNRGVPLTNGHVAKLPQPVMADGLDGSEQKQVMEKLARPGMLSQFLEGHKTSPYTLITKDNDVPGDSPTASLGRRIDLYYVAEGKLSSVASEGFVKQQLEQGQKGKRGAAQYFTAQELKDRNLTVIDTDKLKERYAHAEIPLFGQVKVSGTGHGMRTTTPTACWLAFCSIRDSLKIRNIPINGNPGTKTTWQSRLRQSASLFRLRCVHENLAASRSPDRVFIEYHLVFDEPNGLVRRRQQPDRQVAESIRSRRAQVPRRSKSVRKQRGEVIQSPELTSVASALRWGANSRSTGPGRLLPASRRSGPPESLR